MLLKEKLASQAPELLKKTKEFAKAKGAEVVGQVTVAQVLGGMRGIRGLVCDTSLVEADTGLIIRGRPILELTETIPEEILWLLLTGDMPSKAELEDLHGELSKRAGVPGFVWKVLESMPKDSHPMCMLNTGILCMQSESVFAKRYAEGMKKDAYWDATLEDAVTLIARLPELAAGVYRMRFNKGDRIASDPNLDWGADYGKMLGLPDPKGEVAKIMRLYLVLHSDHEMGNVSAMTTATVNSALSDLYYSLSAGLNGLAGPLHGLANQECLGWILEVVEKFGGSPSEQDLEKFTQDTLDAGKVVPGYGHAVLRVTDPRFTAFMQFGKQHCMDDPVFQTVAKVYDVVPNVLKKIQKISNPWPNVDAISGSLLYYYGLKEFPYYTVLFSISRALGVCSQAVMSRAMGLPIIRPKSSTFEWVQAAAEKK